ncbi:hypothetical protein D9Q98_001472 [Chlorella vulgaris]|uniref:Glycosyltransferase 61 catalytic domain-containing protein n=1 Tax=Chlorella vulgaris TaxID=3077 RepID=A0A9D4U0G8_CHLVU|nr:hypothetical protein D9Q98_001472 [Chlorella vulgaris]
MLFCNGSLFEDEAINLSQAAQFVVRHSQPSLPATPVKYSASTDVSGNGATRVLRVLFITRSPKVAVRQILNMDELLERCQGWKYTDPASSIQFAAECGVWQPGADLPLNIAAVRSADVVIGRHGAGMTNAFFMREGGAMVEIHSSGWVWQLFCGWRDREEPPMLQWWGLTVEDPALLSPGQYELDGNPLMYRVQTKEKKGRDANMHVPWAGLAHVLEQYAGVQAAGGMPAYQARRKREKTVSYILRQGDVMGCGRTRLKRKCPAELSASCCHHQPSSTRFKQRLPSALLSGSF